MRFLQSWWSRTYNRPLKDPILQTYTLEELAYEYFDHKERDAYAEEQQDEEADKIEEAKIDDAMKWAEQEEAKEGQLQAQDAANSTPTITPEDKAWMEEQIRKDKELHGETFGDNIVEEFE